MQYFCGTKVWVMKGLMKYIVAAAIAMLVIVIPFGSWYYLQTGLNYRKAALRSLEPKGSVGKFWDSNSFLGHTSLVYFPKGEDLSKELDIILDQYQDAHTFQLVEVNPEQVWYSDKSIKLTKINASDQMNTASFALVDTAGNIRNYYSHSKEDLRQLVEHLAVILPMAKPKDIRMKNGKDIDAKPKFMKK